MGATLKAWLLGAVAVALSIFYAIFSSTRKENKILNQVNKDQAESLRIVDVKEEVSNTIKVEHKIKEASLEASAEAIKEKVKNETTSNSDTLDPEFIRLLNDNRN